MKKKRKPFKRAAGWQSIKRTLVGGMYTEHAEASQTDLMLPAYAAIMSLQRGTLDHDGFFLLNEMNAVGFCLMEILYERGSPSVKSEIDRRADIPMAASEALESIGHRHNRTGRFGASGPELQAVRGAIKNLDELSRSAPVGVLVRAVHRAAVMVDQITKKRNPHANPNTKEDLRRAAC